MKVRPLVLAVSLVFVFFLGLVGGEWRATRFPVSNGVTHSNPETPQDSTIGPPNFTEIDGHRIYHDPSSAVEVTIREESSSTGPNIDSYEHLVGTGPSVSSSAESLDQALDLQAPATQLSDGGMATAGAASYAGTLTSSSDEWLFYLAGILFLGGGAALAIWGKNPKGGAIIGGVGILIIGLGVTVASYPWVWLSIPLALVVGGVIYVIDSRKKAQVKAELEVTSEDRSEKEVALRKIVKAVDLVTPSVKSTIKKKVEEVSGEADPIVRKQVDLAKRPI